MSIDFLLYKDMSDMDVAIGDTSVTIGQGDLVARDREFADAIEAFLDSLPQEKANLFCYRYGLRGQPFKLMADIAALDGIEKPVPIKKKVTLQCVNRIHNEITRQWINDWLPLSQKELSAYLLSYYDLLNGDCFGDYTLALFAMGEDSEPSSVRKNLNRFMAMSTGESLLAIDGVSSPMFSVTLLKDYWATCIPTQSHANDIEQVDAIIDILKRDIAVKVGDKSKDKAYVSLLARNAFYNLREMGYLEYDESIERFVPRRLSKASSLSYMCHQLGYEAEWLTLQTKVNDSKLCDSVFSETRLENDFAKAVDSGFLFQSERGVYAPFYLYEDWLKKRFPDAGEVGVIKKITEVMQDMGVTIVPLGKVIDAKSSDFADHEYYFVRNAIRRVGEDEDLYFTGKSGQDTLSLNKSHDGMSKADVIMSNIGDNEVVTPSKVATFLRSKSDTHAMVVISDLIKAGRLTKVGMDKYAKVS